MLIQTWLQVVRLVRDARVAMTVGDQVMCDLEFWVEKHIGVVMCRSKGARWQGTSRSCGRRQ